MLIELTAFSEYPCKSKLAFVNENTSKNTAAS